jgi:hypothetical protein
MTISRQQRRRALDEMSKEFHVDHIVGTIRTHEVALGCLGFVVNDVIDVILETTGFIKSSEFDDAKFDRIDQFMADHFGDDWNVSYYDLAKYEQDAIISAGPIPVTLAEAQERMKDAKPGDHFIITDVNI